ncbi:hypothetical protein D9M71_557900 [compost metagenome]
MRPAVEAGHQGLADIVELQTLDPAKAVDTITVGHGIGHRPGAVAVVHHRVVDLVAGELGGVVVERPTAVDQLTGNHQLAGIVATRDHVVDQLGHAEGPVDLRPGAVGVRPHADIDGHRAIAIDQVIAAATRDDVTATAAEDNVAGAERRDTCPKELLQPGDQADVGEDAAVHARGGDGRRIAVVTLEDVAVGRARQAFHELEASQQGRR